MPNVFTAIQPVLFEAAQIVSQEPIGFLNAIDLNFDASEPVALGDVKKVPYAGVGASSSFTPAATAPEGTASTAASVDVAITAIDQVSWNMTGEQILSLQNSSMNNEWLRQKIAQAMRTLRNNAETACGLALVQGASRAIGTAGTNPYNGSTLANVTAAMKELRKNGAPTTDLHLVQNLDAEEAMLNLAVVQNFYQAGTAAQQEKGIILDKMGFKFHNSANVNVHTKGTGTSYVVGAAGALVGATTVPVDGGDSGTILAGDVVTWSGTTDANKYIINSTTASAAAAGNVVLGRPGLKVVRADNETMTIGNTYTGNVAFHRNACVGIIRQPQMPANPTIATTVITDEFGCSYLLCDVAQWGQRSWVMIMAYGFKVVQSEHVVIMMG